MSLIARGTPQTILSCPDLQPRRRIYHEGGDPGFAAFEARYPDDKLVVAVLANEEAAPVREIADAVAEQILSGFSKPVP